MKSISLFYYFACVFMLMLYASCSDNEVKDSFVPEGYINGPDNTLNGVVEIVEVKQNSKSTWRWMLHIQDLNNAFFALSLPSNSIDEMGKPMIDNMVLKQGDVLNVSIDYYRFIMVTQDKVPPLPNAEGVFHVCQ